MKWMKQLATHYEKVRSDNPAGKLIIVFDIDGTILDMRWYMLYLLQSYDQLHQTNYFKDLEISDIEVTEKDIGHLLKSLGLSDDIIASVEQWQSRYYESSAHLLESYRPLQGVMELIRWIQLQPNTSVGLNSSRPEHMREETLELLNQLGAAFKVRFKSDLLYLDDKTDESSEVQSKLAGIIYFQSKNYQVVAVVDNKPENLHALSEQLDDKSILMLHTESVFPSRRSTPFSTESYYNKKIVKDRPKPCDEHVQFVWHSIVTRQNLEKFLETNIKWIEFDVRMDWIGDRVIVRSDSFDKVPMHEDEQFISLKQILEFLRSTGRSIKIDFKEEEPILSKTIEILKAYSYTDDQLWFNAKLDRIGEEGFRMIKRNFPGAILQAPVDFIKPLVLSMPEKAAEIMDDLEQWGINRFSVGWRFSSNRQFIQALKRKGYEVNIYNVPDFESFLQAILLDPTSITSDFNYQNWKDPALFQQAL